jgi:hypothetical protein
MAEAKGLGRGRQGIRLPRLLRCFKNLNLLSQAFPGLAGPVNILSCLHAYIAVSKYPIPARIEASNVGPYKKCLRTIVLNSYIVVVGGHPVLGLRNEP